MGIVKVIKGFYREEIYILLGSENLFCVFNKIIGIIII